MSTIKARIKHLHNTEAIWNTYVTFIPKAGELIVYDVDDKNKFPRFKFGDGKTVVSKLPFATVPIGKQLDDEYISIDAGRI